jgi:tetratricopeptide (TPR) repeat protein
MAADEAPIDTTGLPAGGTFGPSTGLRTYGVDVGPTVGATGTTDGGHDGSAHSGPLKVGQGFGTRYHIIKVLGVGGMGAVYQAWDAELAVAVALKVIRTDRRRTSASAEAERRFKNELLLARQVTHKNVVRIHDLGEIDGIKYITMPYIDGDDLSAVLKRGGRLPLARALRFARQICGGLQAAHEAGVVHRDLKPANIMIGGANIMIGSAGDDEQALIMDFGISASTAEETAGALVGTLEYMAPEQAKSGPVDARADIYAYGLILYEMLTGPRRAASATAQERIAAMQERFATGLPALRAIDPAMPEPLEAVVMKCLATDRAARFQTSAELGAALAALDDAGELIPIATRLTKRMLVTAAALMVLLLAGTYVTTRRLVTPPKAHEPISVLVADFNNRTGDSVFNGTLEQTLGVALEGASFITSYRRDAAQKLAAQMTKGRSLDEETARLISRREGVKVVLTGSIVSSRSGYDLSVSAIDPATGKVLGTSSAGAKSKNDVLPAIGRLGAKVRTVLGDTTPESAKVAAAETVTAASLEAVSEYSVAQDLAAAGNDQDAIAHYQRAIAHDPDFARAYVGLARSSTFLGRSAEAAGFWKQALALMDRMSEREKYRTLSLYYLTTARNYEKAVEAGTKLIQMYPADAVGHNNLAIAYFELRNFDKALEEGRRAVDIYPKSLVIRSNYALYAMYAGAFESAAAEARRVIEQDPVTGYFKAYLPLGMAALDSSNFAAVRDAYDRMAKTSRPGRSLSLAGLADAAMYEGNLANAQSVLKIGIAEDRLANDTDGVRTKQIALAEADEGLGRRPPFPALIALANAAHGQENIVVPVALMLTRAGRDAEAKALAAQLGQQLQAQPRAYAKVIEGEIARRQKRTVDAVEAFQAALKLSDVWLARLGLGITYLEAEHHTEGLAELELCLKRRGEVTAVFLDDVPSYRYLVPLYYWLGRAQEAVGQTQSATGNYTRYVALRGETKDEAAADARRRLHVR